MKTYLILIALTISAIFVFEVHELTRAVREPEIQMTIPFPLICQAHVELKNTNAKGCAEWVTSLYPIEK